MTEEMISNLGKHSNKQNAECTLIYYNDNCLVIITDTDIKSFMKSYREMFPMASVLPKMHLLEDHTIPWMTKWKVGAGLMGEQGAESIHAHIGWLEAQYNGIANQVDKLRYVIQEHNLEASPLLNCLQPAPKRYKKGEEKAM